MRRNTSRLVWSLGLLVAAIGLPSLAHAYITSATWTSFGHHTGLTGAPNFSISPIGLDECDTAMPITFSGLNSGTTTRYIDVWSATAQSAMCQTATIRASTTAPVCTHVSLPASVGMYVGATPFTMMVTPSELFGGCTSATRSFYFFDVASQGDNVTSFNMGQYYVVDITIDATPPSQPTITGSPAGDTVVLVSWTGPNASELGTAGKIRAFVDPAGCGGDGGVTSTTLVAGAAAPTTGGIEAGATSPAMISGSIFGSAGYGSSVAIAIAAVDSAGNVSTLSNVVCAEHVQISGFFDAYCAEHHLSTDACAAYYRGCSVGLPGRRTDWTAVGMGVFVLGLFVIRRRAR